MHYPIATLRHLTADQAHAVALAEGAATDAVLEAADRGELSYDHTDEDEAYDALRVRLGRAGVPLTEVVVLSLAEDAAEVARAAR